MTPDVVFLLDVDNTLLDNDRIIADLRRHLEREFGVASAERYWAIFEALRSELGYADYLGALQRYRSTPNAASADDAAAAADVELSRRLSVRRAPLSARARGHRRASARSARR